MSKYLISFFAELGKLTDIQKGDIPHGITCEQGTLTALVSMGTSGQGCPSPSWIPSRVRPHAMLLSSGD